MEERKYPAELQFFIDRDLCSDDQATEINEILNQKSSWSINDGALIRLIVNAKNLKLFSAEYVEKWNSVENINGFKDFASSVFCEADNVKYLELDEQIKSRVDDFVMELPLCIVGLMLDPQGHHPENSIAGIVLEMPTGNTQYEKSLHFVMNEVKQIISRSQVQKMWSATQVFHSNHVYLIISLCLGLIDTSQLEKLSGNHKALLSTEIGMQFFLSDVISFDELCKLSATECKELFKPGILRRLGDGNTTFQTLRDTIDTANMLTELKYADENKYKYKDKDKDKDKGNKKNNIKNEFLAYESENASGSARKPNSNSFQYSSKTDSLFDDDSFSDEFKL